MSYYFMRLLFLLIILSVSTHLTRTAPASNTSLDENYSDYEDYYDESETERNDNITVDSTSTKARPTQSTTIASTIRTTKKSTSFFNLSSYFSPRSNHVVEPNCPKPCLCLEDYKHILCNGAGLTQIPKDLPTTTLIIDLSENNITKLYTKDFTNITKVREINLSGNRLSTIKKEIFNNLKHLQRIRLTDNQLKKIEPDTFSGAVDLSELDLSNNSIFLRSNGSFLVQPSLLKFACRNCSWTQLYDETFTGLANLNSLNLDLNDFDKKINAKAFTPLQNIIKLRLPELEPEGVTELCSILKTIDNISFKHLDVSCFELVLGTPFNESVTLVTDPPFITPEIAIVPTKLPEATRTKVNKEETETQNKPTKPTKPTTTERTVVDEQKEVKKEAAEPKMSEGTDFSNLTLPTTATRVSSSKPMSTILTAGILSGAGDDTVNSTVNTTVRTAAETENSHQVNISQETVNLLLICIIIIAIVGIIIGIICRKDVGGTKTKCCRTKKPEPKDQVHPTEEIPLNKLAK